MSVRAKMSCQSSNEPGEHGTREVSLSAVYEGDQRLQKISENAIFGDATPNGYCSLVGFYLDRFKSGEEYYVEFREPEDVRHSNDPSLRVCPLIPARLAYRSEPNPSRPDLATSFRYVSTSPGQPTFDIRLAISNPAAIEWLDEHRFVTIDIRLARGRCSDAEIAAREEHLVEYENSLREHYKEKVPEWFKGDFTAFIANQTAPYRRKLAIARGEDVD